MQQLAKPDSVSPFAHSGPLHLSVSELTERLGCWRVFLGSPLSTRIVASSLPATNHETCFIAVSGINVMIFCCLSVGLLPAIYLACISDFVLQPDVSNLAAATVPYAIFSIFKL